MATQVEGVLKATEVRISAATLVSPSGGSVGLLELITELNIFEDLFSSVITGNIVINDSLDLINKIPIIGHEFMLIAFEKPGSNLQFKKVFRVYKMSDRVRVNQQNETYVLHFASEELFLSEATLLSKIYTNQTISSMVQDIALNVLKISPRKFSPDALQPTYGVHTVTIPSWHPLYAINWLSRLALNAQKSASFVWFEDRDGFHFTSLESLSRASAVQNINVVPKNLGFERDRTTTDLQQSQEGIEAYSFQEAFDTLRNINTGMYSGELITVDPLRRRIQLYQFDGKSAFTGTSHLNPFPFMTDAVNRLGSPLNQLPSAYRKIYPTTLGQDSIPYAQGKTTLRPNDVERWLIPRNFYFAGMHATRFSAALPGTINLHVGAVVDVKLPSCQEQERGGKTIDQLFSGHYLVTALRHKIDRRAYACVAEFSKDSLTQALPTPKSILGLEQLKGL